MNMQERMEHLETLSNNHERMINLLITLNERVVDMIEELREEVKKVTRTADAAQRLWVKMAEKHGWLDED